MNFLTKKSVKAQKGFTLVELSITVLIAGLLLTAVMKGQSMLESSRAQKLLHDIKNVEALIGQHSNQKGRLPGDCSGDGLIDFNVATLFSGVGQGYAPSRNGDRASMYDYTGGPLDVDATSAAGNLSPCGDQWTGGSAVDANANRWVNDLKNANIISRSTNNRSFAKHVAEDMIYVGRWTGTTEDFNAITVAGVPVDMAKRILLSFNGSEVSSDIGKIRVLTIAGALEASAVFAARSNNEIVSLIYFFRNQPQ